MSDAPVYWSQPNQQVVRDGEPVGILSDDPDPQTAKDTKAKDDEPPKRKSKDDDDVKDTPKR